MKQTMVWGEESRGPWKALQASRGEKIVLPTWILPFTAAELEKVGRQKTYVASSGLRDGHRLKGCIAGLSPRALPCAAWTYHHSVLGC